MDDSQEHQEDMMDANLMHQSLHMLGQKRLFSDDLDMSFPGQDDERPMPKKKGRKKSFIWSHVMTDEQGKVHCLHCGLLIRVNIGEKVERLRKHFVKSCPKNPFRKDSKEYEELLESVAAPSSMENKKRSGSAAKGRQNRVITYSITFVNSILSGATMDLTPHQIERLEALGNRSTNWGGVKLTGSPTMSYDLTIERIRNCHFSGTTYIGLFLKNVTSEHGIQVPSGLYNSNFSGTCVLSDNCYVWNAALVANVFLGRNTCVVSCGSIVCHGQVSYGTQKSICVGAESDGPGSPNARSTTLNVNCSYGEICSKLMVPRRATQTPCSTSATAASTANSQMNHIDGANDLALFMNMANDLLQSTSSGVAGNSSNQSHLHHTQNPSLQSTQSASTGSIIHTSSNSMAKKNMRSKPSDDYIRYDLTIICDDVEISHCPVVANTFIGGYCKVKSSSVNNSALLSTCMVSFSEVEDCVMHGNSSISGKSLVSGVLMFPHSHVSDGAKVSDSILGPDSSVGVGELKRSILGPFVGFHHTGLLIASLWPLGRGNIGYGAMVGANHTSRSNDQECVPGEGVFFGLASAIRFPFSMLMSPYSIVAANTVCLPQKLAFPFSLIARNETVALNGVVDTSLCALRPGWCLWANAYFLERSLSKFSKRRKSTEYRTDFPVFRPAIVDMILDARHRLLQLRALVQVSEEPSASADTLNSNNSGSGASNTNTAESNIASTGPSEIRNGNNKSDSTPGINKNLYLHGAQVDALGGGRCLIAAKDIDVAYDSYTQFVLRYALHGLLYMLVTGETVPAYHSNHPLQFPNHLHQAQPGPQSQHQHLNTSRAYLRTSASLVGATADSDSEDELEPLHTMRSFSQSAPSPNNSSTHLNNMNAAVNSANGVRPATLLSMTDSSNTPSAAGVSFLLDDLRRLEHNTGTLEEALIRTETRSNREAQQQQRQQLQQHQLYQQQLHHHQQQQQQQSQQPLLSSQSPQLHHLQEQQRALFMQHQQLLQSNGTMPPMMPPTQQQSSQQPSSVDTLTMMGMNSAGVLSNSLPQSQTHLYTTVSPTANNVEIPSTSHTQQPFHSLPQQTMQVPQHTNAATLGMLLFGRSGPAGITAQSPMNASNGSNNPSIANASSTNTSGLGHSATSSMNNVQSASGLSNNMGGNARGLVPGMLHLSVPNLIPAPPSGSSTSSTGHNHHNHHGSVCILTDSHDVAVRQHQLHLLCDLFPEIDFIRFVDAFARWIMLASIAGNGNNNPTSNAQLTALQPILATNGPKIRNLLVRLVELERFYADAVVTSKQKDAHRALEVIVGSADRSQDVDDVMMKARNRYEDITFVVQRFLAYFTQF